MDGYEFKRCDGSEGSVSQRLKDTQKFVDTHFPSCLMCGTDNPYWKLASVETFFGGSTMFRCDKCGGVFQGSNGDLTDGPVDSRTAMFNNMAKTASDLDKNKKFISIVELGSDQSTGLKKGAKIDINDYMSLSNDFKMVKNPITGALISQAMKKSNDAPKPAPAPAPLPAPKPAPAPSQSHSSGFASPIEEIRQYKELMDQGIITPEEFEKKKKLIMGI